jgi:hypothetical protein
VTAPYKHLRAIKHLFELPMTITGKGAAAGFLRDRETAQAHYVAAQI